MGLSASRGTSSAAMVACELCHDGSALLEVYVTVKFVDIQSYFMHYVNMCALWQNAVIHASLHHCTISLQLLLHHLHRDPGRGSHHVLWQHANIYITLQICTAGILFTHISSFYVHSVTNMFVGRASQGGIMQYDRMLVFTSCLLLVL